MELTSYFYKTSCQDLNKNAFFSCPLSHRIVGAMEKLLPGVAKNKYLVARKKRFLPEGSEIVVKEITSRIEQVRRQIDWNQNIHEASYVVFDTETTGLRPLKGDRVISIGGIVIENGHINEKKCFEEIVNPLQNIPDAISKLTGINNTLISCKPVCLNVLPDFLDFIGNKILVAHHAAFDLNFLNLELCRATPLRIINPVIDTFLLSTALLPKVEKCSLENLALHFGIEINGRHTALGDSIATAQIFLRLLEILKGKGIISLKQLADHIALTLGMIPPTY
ncbi:MAG: PolC-type DNA polymerase III [Dethiobacteria bacterium]|jgi:DNA polymerase-3 subunit epsilon